MSIIINKTIEIFGNVYCSDYNIYCPNCKVLSFEIKKNSNFVKCTECNFSVIIEERIINHGKKIN